MKIGIMGMGVRRDVGAVLHAAELARAQREYQEARESYSRAESNFNHAYGPFVSQAIMEMQAAEARVNNALRKIKLIQEENDYA